MSTCVDSFIPPFRFLRSLVSYHIVGKGCRIPLKSFFSTADHNATFKFPVACARTSSPVLVPVVDQTCVFHIEMFRSRAALLFVQAKTCISSLHGPPSILVGPVHRGRGFRPPFWSTRPRMGGVLGRFFLSIHFRSGSTFGSIGGSFGSDPSTTTAGQHWQAHQRCNRKRCARETNDVACWKDRGRNLGDGKD